MTYYVLFGEIALGDALDMVEHAQRLAQAALLAARQVDLGDVARDDRLEPKPRRVRNIFICSGVVFCASSR